MWTLLGWSLVSVAFLAVMFVPLERAWAARAQPILRPAILLDGLFVAGQYLIWTTLSLAILFSVHRAWLDIAPFSAAALPAWAQIALAIVLGDLAMYAFHVASHRISWLWRFHAVHHTANHLDWVAAYREHPVDGILTQLAMNGPAMLLGLQFELFAPFVIFRGMWAIAVHSNTRLPLGPLKWLVGAPELHRYHHRATVTGVKNFANLAPWLDWVFGTHHDPATEDYPLGDPEWVIPPNRPIRRYLGMILGPFAPRRRTPVVDVGGLTSSDARGTKPSPVQIG